MNYEANALQWVSFWMSSIFVGITSQLYMILLHLYLGRRREVCGRCREILVSGKTDKDFICNFACFCFLDLLFVVCVCLSVHHHRPRTSAFTSETNRCQQDRALVLLLLITERSRSRCGSCWIFSFTFREVKVLPLVINISCGPSTCLCLTVCPKEDTAQRD